MKKILCTCGHENPEGTSLCGKCGRPLTEEAINRKVVDMRYDGTAIRSKTHNKTIVDKIWNFFSSVKIGITLIVTILIAASLGTVLPQILYVPAKDPAEIAAYYERVYGVFGKIYNAIGFSDLYSSWWFKVLIGMLAISIIVASLDRGIPLYKSLKNQRVKRHESFMKRQRIFGEKETTQAEADEMFKLAEEKMKQLRYNVRVEDGALLAERGRFARWGPYVNHVGLIIFLFGVMVRTLPGFYVDEMMWVDEGKIRDIPGMPGYYLENKEFIFETYDKKDEKEAFKEALDRVNVVAKNYQTNAILYKVKDNALPGETDDLEKVMEYPIIVNKPMKYDGYSIFQMDFQLDKLKTMHFKLMNKSTEQSLGDISIDLDKPQKIYEVAEKTKVELLGYYPDFSGFENGEPQTKTPAPNNPAFLFRMYTPDKPEGETSFVAIRETLEPLGENQYKMKFQGVDTRDVSGLAIRKDKTIPILILGGIIFMLGVMQGSYWSHRRLWLQRTADGRLLLAAHTNKNWFSIKKDLNEVVDYAKLPPFVDQQDSETVQEDEEGDKLL